MALRHLSPNTKTTPLALVRDGSWEIVNKRFASTIAPQRPAKRPRPTLTLEIPSASSAESVLSLRRKNSFEEGSLADTADEARTCLSGEEAARAEAFVRQLVEMNVKVLALDFDLTLVSMHTGGRWWGSAETLARSVRPVFRTIIPYAQSLGIEVCIVTMSQQTKLISNVLHLSLACDTSKIAVRGGGKNHLVKEDGELDTSSTDGCRKQRHIASVLHSRMQRGSDTVLPCQVMLIDDDSLNVQEALDHEMRGLFFSPDNPMYLVCGIDPGMSFDTK